MNRRLKALAAVLLLAGSGLATAASAAPGHRAAEQTTGEQTTAERRLAAASEGKLPPISQAGLGGAVGLATSVRDTRARVNAVIPPVTTAVYAFTSARPPLNSVNGAFPVPDGLLPAHPKPECNYYVNELNNDLFAVDVDEKTHTFRSVGQFPPAAVSMLAFGTLPITATLTAHQVARNGTLVPIQANQVAGGLSIRKDDPAGNAGTGGCDAEWEHYLPSPMISTAQVDAVFSDVRVDGHPVDVGAHCHTAEPLKLHLIGEDSDHGGSYAGVLSGGPLIMAKDTRTVNPANPIALFPKSSNLTIPPFVGCRGASGQDVSKLVTSFISGPDNTVVVNQGSVILNSFDPAKPSMCDDAGNCANKPDNLNPPAPGR